MEQRIEEELQKIYKFFIEVNFLNFRTYEIKCTLMNNTIKIIFTYDSKLTFEHNIFSISHKIDTELIKLYKNSI